MTGTKEKQSFDRTVSMAASSPERIFVSLLETKEQRRNTYLATQPGIENGHHCASQASHIFVH
ncbi:hypothetical protein [Ruegeria sp. AD91A]|uniref:hypothetical protein n=1 Tax=Ruegeria sp. AD91A TaxID=2293862 RepID=UPI0013C2D7CF|nr:hypothetical protein [Ruegeria sp. AD91A]